MDPNKKLLKDEGELFEDPGRYRHLVGKLNYLTITRPDISYAVSVVSQFLEAPRVSHWEAVTRIIRYLKRQPGLGILYRPNRHLRVEGFTDADWADWAGSCNLQIEAEYRSTTEDIAHSSAVIL
jgi:hypothetical protein